MGDETRNRLHAFVSSVVAPRSTGPEIATRKPTPRHLWLVRAALSAACVAGFLLALGCQSLNPRHALAHTNEPSSSSTPDVPSYRRIELHGIHNAFQVSDKVFSGSQPDDAEAFAALAKLGVTTLISVDGSRPDVATARRHGLRYLHLPFGYDGIPNQRIVELAKAVGSQTGPVFVHCHHGLHRGPAAVAVICEATEHWTPEQAQSWMRAAGTSPDYAGLYRAAATFQPPTRQQLSRVTNLPEISRTSSLVESMVRIDEHFSRLKLCQKAGWQQPPGHADVTPAHEALMLWEQFRELTRAHDTARRPSSYRVELEGAERSADGLAQALKAGDRTTEAVDAAWSKVGSSCAACHQQFRNH